MNTRSAVEMAKDIEIVLQQETLVLRYDGTIYLPDHDTLLVADLHLGKDASFRAAGIPVPAGSDRTTLQLLSKAVAETGADRLIILGDLIHNADSLTEQVVNEFVQWREQHGRISCELTTGNHDRHVSRFPAEWHLSQSAGIQLGQFQLVHETSDESQPETIQIGGHLHPVVMFGGSADRQRLPCFVVDPRRIILPAFGRFKGGTLTRRLPDRLLYPVAGGFVWQFSVNNNTGSLR